MIKKDVVSDLNMSHGKMSDFVPFPLFRFALVIKLRNFDFEGHWNTLIFFDKKNDAGFDYVMSNCQIWFKFCCLSKILTLSLEIRILNLIKIV